jgi:CheY-like chemotaxis protein
MMLPKLGGENVLRALKNNPLTARIPVIVLSGLSQTNEAKLLSEGAAAYLEKSSLGLDAGSDALTKAVRNVLDRPSNLETTPSTGPRL